MRNSRHALTLVRAASLVGMILNVASVVSARPQAKALTAQGDAAGA